MNLSDVKTQSLPESGAACLRPRAATTTNLAVSTIVYLILTSAQYVTQMYGLACERQGKWERAEEEKERKEERKKGELCEWRKITLTNFVRRRRWVKREREREKKKPARLRGRAESCKLENFRAPIISDETTVRHQGSCPVYPDL